MYRPWVHRRFGVEMEVNTRTTDGGSLSAGTIHRELSRVTSRMGSRVGEWFSSDGNTWDVKRDSSCGYEIASPALMLDARGHNEELRDVCRALKQMRPQVDRQCGLHVHVDCSDFTWQDLQALMRLWARYEPFFMELMPRARRSNTYCCAVARSRWDDHLYANEGFGIAVDSSEERRFHHGSTSIGRYSSLNIAGWWRHGRVEFRLHSGTVDYRKIRPWVVLMVSLCQRVKHPTLPPVERITQRGPARSLPTALILKQIGLLPSANLEVPPEAVEVSAYLNARRIQFNPHLAQATQAGSQTQTAEVRQPRDSTSRWIATQAGSQTQTAEVRQARLSTLPAVRPRTWTHPMGMHSGDVARCYASGIICPRPRRAGFRLCMEHSEDFVYCRPYRVFPDTQMEVPLP